MTQHMCVIELSNGEMIQVTPEHRFFSSGEWIAIEDLLIGDTLQTKNGDLLVIENKVIMTNFVEVFNLEVEDNENYYVTEDGILVHNGYKEVTNSGGEKVTREFVDNEDVLLKTAEDAAGGSLDGFTEIKEYWWEGIPQNGPYAGKKIKIEWNPIGHNIGGINEGPHTKIMEWVANAGKNEKGKFVVVRKIFIEGQEVFK